MTPLYLWESTPWSHTDIEPISQNEIDNPMWVNLIQVPT